MKKLFTELQLSVAEVARLMMVSKSTVQSWIERGTIIPGEYRPYTNALHRYHTATTAQVLDQEAQALEKEWRSPQVAALQTRREQLQAQLQKVGAKLEKQQKRQRKLVQHWHLATQLHHYFPIHFPDQDLLLQWQDLLKLKISTPLEASFSGQITLLSLEKEGLIAQIDSIDALLKKYTEE